MKPRSSTGTFASSSGRNWPFRKTMCASLLEPQPQCIPRTSDQARLADGLEGDERMLAVRLAVERHAQRADALALRERRHQRLLRDELGLELVGLALRHGDQEITLDAGFD